MTALLHYATLKAIRDKSLPIFALAPAVMIGAAMLGVTVASGPLTWPLRLDPRNSVFRQLTSHNAPGRRVPPRGQNQRPPKRKRRRG